MMRSIKFFIPVLLVVLLAACSVSENSSDGSGADQSTPTVDSDNPFAVEGGDQNAGDPVVTTDPNTGGGQTQNPPAATNPLEIKTTELDQWKQNEDHKQQLKAHGGSMHYSWSATGLPDGLSISGSKIVGTTTADPKLYSVTLTLKDTDTGETLQTTLNLEVITNISETLKIQAFRFDSASGSWGSPIPVGSGTIGSTSIDSVSKSLKLKVMKQDGSAPSAGAYHWSVRSSENSLGIFAIPSLEGQKESDPAVAYIRPWANGGLASWIHMDLAADGVTDVKITVEDDYGNSAFLNIDTLDIELSPSEESFLNGVLQVQAHPPEIRRSMSTPQLLNDTCQQQDITDPKQCAAFLEAQSQEDPTSVAPYYGSEDHPDIEDGAMARAFRVGLSIKGGLPPYKWVVPETTDARYYPEIPVEHKGAGWEAIHAGRDDAWQGIEQFSCKDGNKDICTFIFVPIIFCEYTGCALPNGSTEPSYLEMMYRNPHTLVFNVIDAAGNTGTAEVDLKLTVQGKSCEDTGHCGASPHADQSADECTTIPMIGGCL